MPPSRRYSAIILELTDVFFRRIAKPHATIAFPKLLTITENSRAWFDFEKGRLSEDDCYAHIATKHGIEPSVLRNTLGEARHLWSANEALFDLIRELRANSGDRLRVFGMANISLPDYEVLRAKAADWSIFDQIFTSCAVGERKPNLGFYTHVLETTKLNPTQVLFVDVRSEHVFSAHCLGMHGIVFGTAEDLKRSLLNLLGDPVKRGQDYLRQNAGRLDSISKQSNTHNATVVHENWTQLLILEATADRTLVQLVEHSRRWNFFKWEAQLTTCGGNLKAARRKGRRNSLSRVWFEVYYSIYCMKKESKRMVS